MGFTALCLHHIYEPINILRVQGRDHEIRNEQVRFEQFAKHFFSSNKYFTEQTRAQLSEK